MSDLPEAMAEAHMQHMLPTVKVKITAAASELEESMRTGGGSS